MPSSVPHSQQSQVDRFGCAVRVCGVVVRGVAFALRLGRDNGLIRILGMVKVMFHRHVSEWRAGAQ